MNRRSFRFLTITAAALLTSLWLASLALAAGSGWRSQVPFWSSQIDHAGWSQLMHNNPTQALGQLPSGVQTMLKTETVDNPWVMGHEEMACKLGRFRPEARQVFDLPYIPIPVSKMKHSYMDNKMSSTMRENMTFSKNGEKMVRFFFHPLYADKYNQLIETYGVKYGEYWATCTSSPRSLVVWQKNQPSKPLWVKVNLHAHLDYYTKRDSNGVEKKIGISRVQSEKKAKRSALVNLAFRSAERANLDRHLIEYMAEPGSFVPADIQYKGRRVGFDRATIFRDIPSALTSSNGGNTYVPAFAFIKGLRETSQRTNIPVRELVTKGLMEPLVRSYIYLGLEHGLSGEMHTQNFLLQVNRQGVPTGKIMVKDLDGFRMDLDMRIRNGKKLDFLKDYRHPFAWAKHSATQGSSSNPAVLQGWFNKLIRNVNGFITKRTIDGVEKTVYATPAGQLMERLQTDFPGEFAQLRNEAIQRDPSLQNNPDKANRKAVEHLFDNVARTQFQKITGIEIPAEKWGYGQNKGLNYGLNKLRTDLCNGQCGLDSAAAQAKLRSAWTYLRSPSQRKADDRTFGRLQAKKFRLIGQNVIEGFSRSGKHAGYAILKPGDMNLVRGLNPQQRTRTQSHLSRYSADPGNLRAQFRRGQ